jgi:hypothetical protein
MMLGAIEAAARPRQSGCLDDPNRDAGGPRPKQRSTRRAREHRRPVHQVRPGDRKVNNDSSQVLAGTVTYTVTSGRRATTSPPHSAKILKAKINEKSMRRPSHSALPAP